MRSLHVGLTARRSPRSAMTLIELLVVLVIIALLGGIIALVGPKFSEQSRVAEGARQFTMWLELAHQRAQADKAPRGLRLIDRLPTSTSSEDFYYKFAYVEQPEDVTATPTEIPATPNTQHSTFQQAAATYLQAAANNTTKYTAGQRAKFASYYNLLRPANANNWQFLIWLNGRDLSNVVAENDVIEFAGARYTVVIDAFQGPTAASSLIILNRARDEFRATAVDVSRYPLPPIRITRSPRPISGEPELTLPSNVAIDFYYPPSPNTGPTRTIPVPQAGGPPGTFDIMFSQSGEVIGSLGSTGRVVFWMRDVSLTDPGPGKLPPGDNRLVVLHCRTGQVTAHPVNPAADASNNLTDPYSFVRDGKSSAAED